MAWRATLLAMPIYLDIGKEKLGTNGYVNFFATEEEAAEYKWKQLMRIRTQYRAIGHPLPEQYESQIKEMEIKYERKEIS